MKNVLSNVISQQSAMFSLILVVLFHPSVFEKTNEMLGTVVKIVDEQGRPTLAGLIIHSLVAFIILSYLKKMTKTNGSP